MIKAVVFDLDHTLYDRHKTLEFIVRELMSENFELLCDIDTAVSVVKDSDDKYAYFGWDRIFENMADRGIISREKYTSEDIRTFFWSNFARTAFNFDGIEDTLTSLKNRGLKLGIITNGNHELQSKKISLIGLEKYFDDIMISGDTPYNKPQKEIFELMAQRMGIKTHEMVYVGDAPENDVYGSRCAGCVPVWVKSTGTWSKEFEHIEKPKLQLEHLLDIERVLVENGLI